jgi:hypothetical protein
MLPPVYDTDSIGVCKILKQMNNGSDLIGKSIGAPTSYCYGVAVNPVAKDMAIELNALMKNLKMVLCLLRRNRFLI